MSQYKDLPAHLWTKEMDALNKMWRVRSKTKTWSGFRTEQEASHYKEHIRNQLLREGAPAEEVINLSVEEMQ